jgi:tripartite-type tricarboxylate transporter receptor subunit TctC
MTRQPNRRHILLTGLAGAAATLGVPAARAQAWPSRPGTVIVPFPAGGGTDAFARPLFAAIGRNTGRQFVIDNRGGAGGTVGASLAAKATPDGYNFFMGAVHHTIAPSMYPRLDYDILTDLVPVGLVASVPQVVVVNPQRVQQTDLPSFIEHVRRNPGRLNYGSAGNGTSHHLAGELFKIQTKTFITHIPYRGAGPMLQDLVAGQVDMCFDGMGSSSGHIRGGRIRPLAVASEKRVAAFPDLPTAAEQGLPDYKVSTWYGIWAPRGTPADAIAGMQNAMRAAFAADEVRQVWTNQGAEMPNLWGAEYGRFIASEVQRWAAVVKASGAKLD